LLRVLQLKLSLLQLKLFSKSNLLRFSYYIWPERNVRWPERNGKIPYLFFIGGSPPTQGSRHGSQTHNQGDQVPAAQAGPFCQGYQASSMGQHGKFQTYLLHYLKVFNDRNNTDTTTITLSENAVA